MKSVLYSARNLAQVVGELPRTIVVGIAIRLEIVVCGQPPVIGIPCCTDGQKVRPDRAKGIARNQADGVSGGRIEAAERVGDLRVHLCRTEFDRATACSCRPDRGIGFPLILECPNQLGRRGCRPN